MQCSGVKTRNTGPNTKGENIGGVTKSCISIVGTFIVGSHLWSLVVIQQVEEGISQIRRVLLFAEPSAINKLTGGEMH